MRRFGGTAKAARVRRSRRSDRRAGFSRPIESERLYRPIARKFAGSSFFSGAPVADSPGDAGGVSGCGVGFFSDPVADPGDHGFAVALAGFAPRECLGAGGMRRGRKPGRWVPDLEAGEEKRRSGARSVCSEAITGAHEALGARTRGAGGLCVGDPASTDTAGSVFAGGGCAQDSGSPVPAGVRLGACPALRPDRVAWGDVRPPRDRGSGRLRSTGGRLHWRGHSESWWREGSCMDSGGSDGERGAQDTRPAWRPRQVGATEPGADSSLPRWTDRNSDFPGAR